MCPHLLHTVHRLQPVSFEIVYIDICVREGSLRAPHRTPAEGHREGNALWCVPRRKKTQEPQSGQVAMATIARLFKNRWVKIHGAESAVKESHLSAESPLEGCLEVL